MFGNKDDKYLYIITIELLWYDDNFYIVRYIYNL